MGSGRFDYQMYTTRSVVETTREDGTRKSVDEVFTARSLELALDPKGIKLRESCDSADNPNSTAIMLALDVTGSMGVIPDYMMEQGLGDAVQGILDKQPVSDPHIMLLGIGDVKYDRAPLQASQFEADMRMMDQFKLLYIERGGGGNAWESYNLPWYFALMKTKIDCFEKRGKKGYLFTVGDEYPPYDLTASQLTKVFGPDQYPDVYENTKLLENVQERYNVFHIVVKEGSCYRRDGEHITAAWRNLLGKHVIPMADYKCLGKIISAVMQVNEGADPYQVAEESGASKVIAEALGLTFQAA